MKRRHEEIARSEFADWLLESVPGSDVSWREPPAGQDHPDWYLDLNGTTYAVEATTIVPTIGDGKNTVLEPTISAAIGDFIDRVEAKANAEGCLVGAYAVSLGPMPNSRKVRERVSSRILEYVRATKDQPIAELRTVDHVGGHAVEVQKFHMGRNYLAEMIDLGTRSESEVREDFRDRLRTQVERKSARYTSFENPVLLLLLDGFHIVDPEDWLDAASSIPSISQFEAVFRIKPVNKPLLLFSESQMWNSIGPKMSQTDA